MTAYKYNPHRHTKIWLSNNPNVFMSLENQIRLIKMREKNPADEIHFIYDSSLLSQEAIDDLMGFCKEHRLIPIDVDTDEFKSELKSENEEKLYAFYKDEVTHLKEGGNLAVASDILRWISPVYKLGAYTDFDFPVDTSSLPPNIEVEAPLLMNIGSLKMNDHEFILSNNDYIAIVNADAAQEQIEKVQTGIINKLEHYSTDFIEQVEHQLQDGFINRCLLNLMRNRSETFYISKSNEITINDKQGSSRQIRHYIRKIMSDKELFLEFNRHETETNEQVVKRLRVELREKLNAAKYLFFHNEYSVINRVLHQDDEAFLAYVMKNELNLYLKSIVVCTTGPLEISRALFGNYVVNSQQFAELVQPFSFNHYNLQKAFQSKNSIPMHENVVGMIRFLGGNEGETNDSSWLESGRQLQAMRVQKLSDQRDELAENLPNTFLSLKTEMQDYVNELSKNSNSIFFKDRKRAKREALESILECFTKEDDQCEFDTNKLAEALIGIYLHKKQVFAGLFFSQTKKLITEIEQLSQSAIIFSLTEGRKIKFDAPADEFEIVPELSDSVKAAYGSTHITSLVY